MSGIDLEAIADAAEAAVFAMHHQDLCACGNWPDNCRYFPKGSIFSVNAYDVVVAAAPLFRQALAREVDGDNEDGGPEVGATMHHDEKSNEWVMICDEHGELGRGNGNSAEDHDRLATEVWAVHDREVHGGDGFVPDSFLIGDDWPRGQQ